MNYDKLLSSCVTITNTLRKFSIFSPIVAIEAILRTGRKKKKNLPNIRLLFVLKFDSCTQALYYPQSDKSDMQDGKLP